MSMDPSRMVTNIQTLLTAAGHPASSTAISTAVLTAICQGIINEIILGAEVTGYCPQNADLVGGKVQS